jgi:DNA-binding PadR family transcriptional regulator
MPFAMKVVSPLQFLVLLQLHQSPKYGYEILKALRSEFDGLWELKTGTIYPSLKSLESRGFLESNVIDETEFYSLSEKGRSLLDQLGERFEHDYKFAHRYFRTIMKWMPPKMKNKVLNIIQTISKENIDVYSNWQQFFDETMDKERRLKILDSVRSIFRVRLEGVEKLYNETRRGESI